MKPAARWVWLSFPFVLLTHFDFWRVAEPTLIGGWLPPELAWRIVYIFLAWFWIMALCRWAWPGEDRG